MSCAKTGAGVMSSMKAPWVMSNILQEARVRVTSVETRGWSSTFCRARRQSEILSGDWKWSDILCRDRRGHRTGLRLDRRSLDAGLVGELPRWPWWNQLQDLGPIPQGRGNLVELLLMITYQLTMKSHKRLQLLLLFWIHGHAWSGAFSNSLISTGINAALQITCSS